MAQCPFCHQKISSDFGLTTCEGCGQSIFVDMEGHPQVEGVAGDGGQESLSDHQTTMTHENNHLFQEERTGVRELGETSNSAVESEAFENEAYGYEINDNETHGKDFYRNESDLSRGGSTNTAVQEYLEEVLAEVEFDLEDGEGQNEPLEAMGLYDPEPTEESSEYARLNDNGEAPSDDEDLEGSIEESSESEEFKEFDESVVVAEPVGDKQADPSTSIFGSPSQLPVEKDLSDMSDLADYGNSEVSLGRDGALRYSIKISGIDSKDIRIAVRDSLNDRRFIWSIEELMSSIKEGQLILNSISAVKTAIIIQRLKGLPIEISWEQSAIFHV